MGEVCWGMTHGCWGYDSWVLWRYDSWVLWWYDSWVLRRYDSWDSAIN